MRRGSDCDYDKRNIIRYNSIRFSRIILEKTNISIPVQSKATTSSLHVDLSKSPRHRPISVSPPLQCKFPIKTADPFRGIENDLPVVFLHW